MATCSIRAGRVCRWRALVALTLLMPVISLAQVSTNARAAADTSLLRIVSNASAKNKLPADLMAYKASVETEVDVLIRHSEGTETSGSIDQLASQLRWTRAGTNEQRVIGYRSQTMGLSVAMLGLPTGWLNPVLYGNRLRTIGRAPPPNATDDSTAAPSRRRLRVVRPSSKPAEAARPGDTIAVIHPLAADRERYYTYSRGDTLVTLRSGGRSIPIVRVHVEPRHDIKDSVAVFIGDIDLDVSRGTLVRMRGYFARAGVVRRRGVLLGLLDAFAFVEFENAEYDGKYWLPAVQRIELQAMSPLFGDARAVVRIVSRFPAITVNDTTLDSLTLLHADSLRNISRRKLTYASTDSLAKYSDWKYALGNIGEGLHADDFDDIAPDRLRSTGAPRVDIMAERASDVIRFNRVEGLYTGLGVKLALRDWAPGIVVRANAGWAWSEKTARARVSVDRTRGAWTIGVRAGRSLDITNDFRNPTDSGRSIGALGTDDAYDYVDRRSAAIGVTRTFRDHRASVHADFGIADDRYAATTLVHGLFGKGTFLPDRGVDEGSYRRTSVVAEWHPFTDAVLIRPSFTSRFLYERGDGTLSYQRAEVRAIAVRLLGPFTWTVRGDVGALFGRDLPPQQLFELGREQNLPGYKTKEFAGTHAAVFRTNFLYRSRFLSERIHITRNWWLPSPSPGASIGLQSGWTDAPGEAARASILRLGMLPDSNGVIAPVSGVTGNVRATASIGLRFFSGNLFVGFARPIDHVAPWKFRIGGGI